MTVIGWLEGEVLTRAPDFMRGPNMGRFLKSIALSTDGALESLRQGLTFSNPLTCPAWMLPVVSKDRGVPIWPTQTEESRRTVLANWHSLHRLRGSHEGVLRLLRHYFEPGPFPRLAIVHQAGDGASCEWHELHADGSFTITRVVPSNFNYDPHSDRWSRWFLVIDDMSGPYAIPAITAPRLWDGGIVYDTGAHWDGMFPQPALDLLGMALLWKRAGTRLQAIIVNRLTSGSPGLGPASTLTVYPDGTTSLPISNWGSPIDTATGAPTRPVWADWIYEAGG